MTASGADRRDRCFEVRALAGPPEVARAVADIVVELVRRRPDAVLGLPTGSTPLPLYRELIRRAEQGEVSFSAVTVFLLDEFVGLPDDDPRSFLATIRREFTDAAGIAPDNVHGPSTHGDLDRTCVAYDGAIDRAGGVDLQLLGIGRNGHIGFNEPGTPFELATHVTELAPETRADAELQFGADEVPTRAITQGPATILLARRALLLATGATKAPAVAAMVEEAIADTCPASILRLHQQASAFVDAGAASALADRRRHRPQGSGR